MISGKISSYKGYVDSKKSYLKRKKWLNREIKRLDKKKRNCKGLKRALCERKIEKGKDDLFLLKVMYNYYKIKSKRK